MAPRTTRTAPPRRTQAARRDATIRLLLDAATATLIARGYAETSVARICTAAKLSQGALFRHFATREAVMVAVGRDLGERQLARYRRRFVAARTRHGVNAPVAIATALELVRDACRSPLNQAWYELTLAARTSPALRAQLAPVARMYDAAIVALATELLPDYAARLGARFAALVGVVVAAFDGETIHRSLVADRAHERARLQLLAQVFETYGASAHSGT